MLESMLKPTVISFFMHAGVIGIAASSSLIPNTHTPFSHECSLEHNPGKQHCSLIDTAITCELIEAQVETHTTAAHKEVGIEFAEKSRSPAQMLEDNTACLTKSCQIDQTSLTQIPLTQTSLNPGSKPTAHNQPAHHTKTSPKSQPLLQKESHFEQPEPQQEQQHPSNNKSTSAIALEALDTRHAYMPAPLYPKEARRNKEAGKILFEMSLNDQGCVQELHIKASTASSCLEKSAKHALFKWQFPVEILQQNYKILVPVNFVLN